MRTAFIEKVLDGRPPAWVRKVEAAVILGVFARAFDVEPPALEALSADDALLAFREFTAACMEAALADRQVATRYRERLRAGGFGLGDQLRQLLRISPASSWQFARFAYRGIGIDLSGDPAGNLQFGPCMFAGRYTPADCWFMSAFDEGFLRGVTGMRGGELVFSCRLTEGADRCLARFASVGNADPSARRVAEGNAGEPPRLR